MANNFYASYPVNDNGVSSLNGLTGALTLVAGTGITITPSGSNITISATGISSAITSINSDTTAAQTLTVGTSGTDFAITNPGSGSHIFNLPTASASNRGALSSADWSTFNSKQNALTITNLTDAGTDGIIITNGTGAVIGSSPVTISQAAGTSTQNGYLVSTDWQTFNNKANNNLNNLAGTTQANSSISPQLDVTYDLGAISKNWLMLHARYAGDASSNVVIDFANRLLKNSSGVSLFDFSGSSPSANTHTIINVVDPVNPQDAATKNYVDTHSGTGVTSISIVSANGFAGTSSGGTTPALTLSTTITGLLIGNGTAISAQPVTNLTDVGTDGITIINGIGAVLGSSAVTISQHVADTTHNGYLSNTDWNTFNSKQAAGNYITALTGDVTASGPGSVASTLATVNANVGSFTNSSITVNAKGLITAASSATTTGSGNTVLATAPTLTNPIVGTQTQGDSSTKAASTSYVDVAVANAVNGINPAVAVQAATTSSSDTSGFTYNNGVSGVGATFTGSTNTAVVIDGFTFNALGQRLLVKNDTQSPSGAFNGIYYVTQLQTGILPPILTRALDYDMPSDINNTGAIPVINGTVNNTTSWVETALITSVGVDPLSFTEFTRNPADYLLKANNLSDVSSKTSSFNNLSPMTTLGDIIYGGTSPAGTGTRLAGNTTSTKNFLIQTGTGSVSAAPSWGTIAAGDVPTLNQNTTGTASNITASSNSTLTTLSALSLPASQLSGTLAAAQFPALTGDITTSAGSLTTTLATVNSNVGSFGSSTSIPSFTVNGKGLITAASGNAVIAPAGTLSGTTLNSTVVSSSITSVGTITSGTWTGTTIATANGGTGQTTYTDGQLLIGNSSNSSLTKSTLTAGSNITITNGNGSISIAASSSANPAYNVTSQTSAYNAVISDYIIASGASFTITLPTAVSQSGKQIVIQHNGTSLSQAYTLNTTSSQTINGPGGTVSSGNYVLQTNGEKVTLISDGSNWQVMEHDTLTLPTSWTPMFNTHFTVSSANATVGAVYTNNGQTFVVVATIAAQLAVNMVGTGNPTASGTLTKSSGTGDATITFSAFANSIGTVTSVNAWWTRKGNRMQAWGSLLPGTSTSNLFAMSLPGAAASPVVLDTNYIAPTNTTANPGMKVGVFQGSGGANAGYNFVTATSTNTSVLFNANIASGTTPLTPQSTQTGITSGALISWDFDIPISGWQP